jgi:hypothetical protein
VRHEIGPLLAEDGARLYVSLRERGQQVIAKMQVRNIDLGLSETAQEQICIDLGTAHEFVMNVAEDRMLPVIWEDAEFCASISEAGQGEWEASWTISYGHYALMWDVTRYHDPATARFMVKSDARKQGYEGRIKWLDGYAE